jgi:hypothetical protein
VKGSDDVYLKIVFYIDALVKGSSSTTTTDVQDKDSDDGGENDPASDVETSK